MKSFEKTKYLNFQDAYRALYNKLHNDISYSYILPQKYQDGSQSLRERDPKFFEKLHSEKLKQVKLSAEGLSISKKIK